MIGRARTLRDAGYAVLAIDLPGHGASGGERITFGADESRAVGSARAWLRARRPGTRVGAIGVSLGGAALLLERAPDAFDALVVEAVYPDLDAAVRNRIAIRLGDWPAAVLAPALE